MPPRPRRFPSSAHAVALALAVLGTMLVLTACGGKDESGSSASSGPATAAPADSALYAEVLVRPEGDVEDGVVAAARRVLRVEDPGATLRRILDDEIDGERGLYSRRVEPWLGDRIGVFVLGPQGGDAEDPDAGLLFTVRDRGAAERMLATMRRDGDTRRGSSYRGVAYDVDREDDTPVALLDDAFFAGTLPAFRAAVDAARGASLAESARFTDAVDTLGGDDIAFAYVDPEPLLPLLRASANSADPSAARLLEQFRGAGPLTMSLTAKADEIALELSADERSVSPTHGSGEVSLGDLPGDAWLALATPPLGALLRQSIERSGQHAAVARQLRLATGLDLDRDVLGWLGGVAAFVRGTSPLELGGGIVLGTADEAASRRLIARVEGVLGVMGMATRRLSSGDGFEVLPRGLPQRIVVRLEDGKVVIGFGAASADDALDPRERFADSSSGKAVLATLGDGYEPSFALVFEPMLSLMRVLGLDDDPDFRSALPYLTAYRSVAAGTKRADGRVTVRVVAGLKDPEPAEGRSGDDGDDASTQ